MQLEGSTFLFEAEFEIETANVVAIPVPFDRTASYRPGSAVAPLAIADASDQCDELDPWLGDLTGIRCIMLPEDPNIQAIQEQPEIDDSAGQYIRDYVRLQATNVLDAGRIPAVIGGEHSVSLGAIEACALAHPDLTVLQIDAHMDLRHAYEGLKYSHASVMRNVFEEIQGVTKIVQVGIRDYCHEELNIIKDHPDRVISFFDARDPFDAKAIVKLFDGPVYITFDIDGLEPSLCPDTGTPVPGGLSWRDAMSLLQAMLLQRVPVVGLDVVEVSPSPFTPADQLGDDYNAAVGARILQRLCALSISEY